MSTNPSDMVRSGAPMVERLPYEPEAERAVLGAVLLDPNALLMVMDKVREEEFYIEAHRLIYSTCLALNELGQAADLLTVTNHLREQGQLERVGGPAYLSSMVDALPDVANAGHYGEIVHDKSVKRRLIVAAQKILTTCSMDHGEAREAVEAAQRDVYMGEGCVVMGIDIDHIVKTYWGLRADLSRRRQHEQQHSAGPAPAGDEKQVA